MEIKQSLNLIKSLGFHPQIDSFNYELFDADRFQLHIMDCVGALICLQKEFNNSDADISDSGNH